MRTLELVCLASLTLAGAAAAQAPRALAVGQTVNATLGPNDPQRGGRAYHLWELTVNEAGPVQVEMLSDSVDAYLVLQDSAGRFLNSDDNTAGGHNARIRFDATGPGRWRLLARSSTNANGSYTLRTSVPRPTTEGIVGTITRGQQVTGTLAADAPKTADGKPYAAWTYEGAGGDSITIELRSDAFDTFLIVQDMTGQSLGQNDDADGELNSKLTWAPPRPGRYRIIATAFNSDATGAFTLRIR